VVALQIDFGRIIPCGSLRDGLALAMKRLQDGSIWTAEWGVVRPPVALRHAVAQRRSRAPVPRG